MTADKIIDIHYNMNKDEDGNKILYFWEVKEALIEFAKFHVKAALKAASENVTIYDDGAVSMSSIIDAYPLRNIK